MNEMMVTGWFYLPTVAKNTEEAYADFIHRCREIGMNPDNIQSLVLRDKDGNDVDEMKF